MADLNYVSPLTSDLTDYYTKTEVDELQQGDAATFATTAQVDSKDNAVKDWVENKGYLTQHQSLANYATKNYVDDAIAGVEVSGVSIEVVNALPSIQNARENVIYLVLDDSSNTGNIYNEWVYVPAAEDFEMIGNTAEGVIPDLTDYATKSYVDTAVAGISVDAKDVAYDNAASGLEASNVKNAIDEVYAAIPTMPVLATVATSGDYDDLSNKPTIPSLTGYATTTYVDDAVSAVVVPDISGLATEQYVDNAVAAIDIPDVSGFVESSDLAAVATSGSYNDLTDKPVIPAAPDLSSYATKSELSAKANAADLATVATSGSYNDLTNKPTIPSTSGLASETYVDNAIAAIDIPDVSDFVTLQDIAGLEAEIALKQDASTLAAVATSGDYDDLTNKPSIPDTTGMVTQTWVQSQGYLTSHQDISGKVDGTVVSGTTTAKIFNEADGGGAQIITASARGFAGVHDGSNPDATYATMYVKNAAGTSTLARVDLDGDGKAYYLKNGASKAAGSEIAVKGDIPDVSNFITANDLPDLSGYAETANLATVATSGDYDDLTNKPTIPSITGLATETYVDNAVAGISVPANTSDLTNDSGFITSADLPDTSGFVESSDLATVATSGSYNDLTDKPNISGTITDYGLLDILIDILINNRNYNYANWRINSNQTEEDFNTQFKAGWDTGKWGFLQNAGGGGPLKAATLGVPSFTFIHIDENGSIYQYDSQTSLSLVNKGHLHIFRLAKDIVLGVNPSSQFGITNRVKSTIYSLITKYYMPYSNTNSGLTATTIQGAIDELAANSGSSVSYSYDANDGYLTLTGLVDDSM